MKRFDGKIERPVESRVGMLQVLPGGRRRRFRVGSTLREPTRQGGLEAEPGMDHRPEQNQRHARFAGGILILGISGAAARDGFIVVLAQILGPIIAQANAGRQTQNGASGQNDREDQHADAVPADQPVGKHQDGVAQDTAKPGRQGPAGGDREKAGEARRKQSPGEPKSKTRFPALQAAGK